MQFKHGDRVTCEIMGEKITDARISIDANGRKYICQNTRNGNTADNKLGYKYSWILDRDFTEIHVTNLRLAPKTLEDIEVGDVIVDTDKEECPILMRSGQVVVLGRKRDYGMSSSNNYSIDELRHCGYKIKQPEPETAPVEMTVAQVAEKLGYEVKIVK